MISVFLVLAVGSGIYTHWRSIEYMYKLNVLCAAVTREFYKDSKLRLPLLVLTTAWRGRGFMTRGVLFSLHYVCFDYNNWHMTLFTAESRGWLPIGDNYVTRTL